MTEQITMKTMKCSQLGGACEKEFHANTFEEIAAMSKKHGLEMFQAGDKPHLDAMKEMQDLMKVPGAAEAWFEQKRKIFESLPDPG